MAPLIYLTLLLALSGVRSNPVEGEFTAKQRETVEEVVEKHAPFLRFHKMEGESEFCFPHDATEYFQTRLGEDWSTQCNMNYTAVHNGLVPTYWHAQPCGDHLHIAYWTFTGFNHNCDGVSGARDAWWEFMVVKVRNWETAGSFMGEVMYGQKKGWYTRIPNNYELMETSHPVAYVGRASHGFYHNSGGTNTCCYFEDTRNPGNPDHFMRTYLNLVELKTDGTGEAWMTEPSTHYWNGILPPTYRDNWDLCRLLGCEGSFLQLCGTCGCHRSDIGDDVF